MRKVPSISGYVQFKLGGLFIRFVKYQHTVRKINVSVNDSRIKSYCLFPQSFSSVKFKLICFVTILSISLKSRSCKNDHILFNVGISILEARPPIEDPMKGNTFDLRNNTWQAQSCANIHMGWAFIFLDFTPRLRSG